MLTPYRKEQQKMLCKERKVIEGILHPVPEINGCEILHEHHTTGYITFTAWKGREKAHPLWDRRSFEVHRLNVFGDPEFYKTWHEELRRLTIPREEYDAIRRKEMEALVASLTTPQEVGT